MASSAVSTGVYRYPGEVNVFIEPQRFAARSNDTRPVAVRS